MIYPLLFFSTLLYQVSSKPFAHCVMAPRMNGIFHLHKDHFSITNDYTVASIRKRACKLSQKKFLCYHSSGKVDTPIHCNRLEEDAGNYTHDLICVASTQCNFNKKIEIEGFKEPLAVEYCCCAQDVCYYGDFDLAFLIDISTTSSLRLFYRRLSNITIIFTLFTIITVSYTILHQIIIAGCKWPKPVKKTGGAHYIDEILYEDYDEEAILMATQPDTDVRQELTANQTQPTDDLKQRESAATAMATDVTPASVDVSKKNN